MTRFALALTGLIVLGCGGGSPTSSPSSPTPVQPNEYNWRGVTRRLDCADSTGGVACASSLHKLATFALKLEPSGSGGAVQGSMTAMFFQFNVTGRVSSDGSVSLTGQGTGLERVADLTAWNTRITSTGMTGSFSYTQRSVFGGESLGVTAALENVVPFSSFTSVPPESRFAMTLQTGFASRFGPSSGISGFTTYDACARFDNPAATQATVTFTMTAIGPDTRDYADVQQLTRPLAMLSPLSSQVGCSYAGLRDANYTRSIATRYRLRAEYAYGDGVSGVAEDTADIRVDRDTLPRLLPALANHF